MLIVFSLFFVGSHVFSADVVVATLQGLDDDAPSVFIYSVHLHLLTRSLFSWFFIYWLCICCLFDCLILNRSKVAPCPAPKVHLFNLHPVSRPKNVLNKHHLLCQLRQFTLQVQRRLLLLQQCFPASPLLNFSNSPRLLLPLLG
jgi:hypothetical protein